MTLQEFGAGAAAIALLGSIVWLLFAIRKGRRQATESNERRVRRERDVNDFMSLHQRALARKRWQLVQPYDYDNIITKKWDKEKRDFISTLLVPHLIDLGHVRPPVPIDKKFEKIARERLHQQFDPIVEQWAAHGYSSDNDNIADVTTGQEYEQFCAERLTRNGWRTRLTRSGGDQGIDIIGDLHGLRVVFQCKFYTSPVGDKAVQEALAALFYERADLAVVISNAPFTRSAETLARTRGTILIHHDDIPSLREVVKTRKVS